MLSISVKTAAGAANYYIHMQADNKGGGGHEDYYAAEGAGEWRGAGAAALGLSGSVSAADFKALTSGYAPDGETALVQNAGDKDRRAGWDLTFSAPKSVSLAWANADDNLRKAIETAHADAVNRALELVQDKAAFSRRGKEGATEESANLVIATFQHGTSRELDPQLHTHAFVINAALREDGTFGTLQGKHLFDWKMAGGALYRAELASQMQKLGFSVERDGDSFRLSAVSTDAEREFSKRRQQIEAALKESGYSSAAASEKAALSTRKAKDHDIDPEKLREQWQEAGREYGLDNIERSADVAKLDKPDIADILDQAHQNKSVSREQDIYTAAFQAAQGYADAAGARALSTESIGDAVTLGKGRDNALRFSTHEIVAAEKRIIEVAQTFDKAAHGIPQRDHQSDGPALSAEQKEAREYMAAPGSLKVLIGDAGTGKSTMLRQVAADHYYAGYQTIGCATAGKAAAGLQESAGIQSQTIASLIRQIDAGESPLHSKALLVIDEAGMVDSRNMARLMDEAEKSGAKIALVGDYKQLQPVGSGATFAKLAEAHGDPARLQEIHRQRDDWHKSAVTDMSRGEAGAALEQYVERGLVSVEKTHRAAVAAVAEKIIDARAQVLADSKYLHPDMAQARAGAEVLGIASTNQAVNDINQAVRAALTKSGEITDVRDVTTAAGKLEIGAGDRLLITKNDNGTGLKNGDLATVLGWDKQHPGALAVRLDRDPAHVTLLSPNDLHLRHGFAITTHKSQGATVEKAVILGSEHTSREVAYVQSSRARDSTEWVFSKAKVQKLAEQAPPTEKMAAMAQDIESKRLAAGDAPALDKDTLANFADTRDYLNKFAYRIDSTEQQHGPLAELKNVMSAMSKSQQKESTLDYQPAASKEKDVEREGLSR